MGSNVYKNTLIRIKHDQDTPATTWTIVHGLNTACPIIDVYVLDGGSYTRVWPEHINVIDLATAEVVFTQATSGFAMVM